MYIRKSLVTFVSNNKWFSMALVFNGESIGVTDTGTDVTVPDHPKARLMYYLNCMYTVLSLDQAEHNIARLTDYGSYYLLSDEETADMFQLSALLDPVTLTGVCIFHDAGEYGYSNNGFYEINTRRTTFAAAESVMVGNVRVSVKKIMCYNTSWLIENFILPLSHFAELYQNAITNRTPPNLSNPPSQWRPQTRLNRQNRRYGAISNHHTQDDDGCCCCVIL